MKGVIFRGFLEFTEQQFGDDYVEFLIHRADLPSLGAYTNIGTYAFEELVTMVSLIIKDKGLVLNDLLESFGYFTFGHLQKTYPQLVAQYNNSFECIYHVDQTIHKNVVKIHPDAQLPDLQAQLSEDQLHMTLNYQSKRPLIHFAIGLIKGCIGHFNDQVSIQMSDHSIEGKAQAIFELHRVS